jgi:glycosyltransferase involved in cell wall biosynthesis
VTPPQLAPRHEPWPDAALARPPVRASAAWTTEFNGLHLTAPVYVNGKFAAQRTTGVQRVARELLRALDERVPTGRWTLLCPPQADPPPLRRIALRVVGAARWPLHAWEQWTLPRAARDGLLVNLAGPAPAFARWQCALLHDAAVFDHPEAYTPAFRGWYRWLFRHLARRGDTLLTISEFSRGRLAAALQVPPSRFESLPLGADHLQRVPPDEAVLDAVGLRGRRFVLVVGSANPTKNLGALVAAWASLHAADARLAIAGGANAGVFARGEAADPPGVVRLGPVDDAALVALYRHALALVFPSRYEGFGLPPLEAMGFGCPVLAARTAAIPEACGDAVQYLDGIEAASIADGLRQLLDDEGLRRRLQHDGPVQAARWRWARSAEVLEALVEKQARIRVV